MNENTCYIDLNYVSKHSKYTWQIFTNIFDVSSNAPWLFMSPHSLISIRGKCAIVLFYWLIAKNVHMTKELEPGLPDSSSLRVIPYRFVTKY